MDSFGFYGELPRQGEAIHSQPPDGFTATSARRIEQEVQPFLNNRDECGSPPTLLCRRQRCPGHHHHAFDQVAGQYAANKTIAVTTWRSPLQVFLETQEEEPLTDLSVHTEGSWSEKDFLAATSQSRTS